jgi:UDP-3-O-[3-hydroxymyristoyl] N-acetylglucosamine deacetylase
VNTRNTLAGESRLSGWGLHGGRAGAVTLAPAPPGTGRVFVRAGVRIPATIAYVVDARRATTLGRDGARVGMVEHLLAALLARGIDDAELHVEGDEVPLLDGCARAWADAIDAIGARTHGDTAALRPRAPCAVHGDGGAFAEAQPCDALTLEVNVHFAPPGAADPATRRAPVHAERWEGDAFETLLDARTFGFPHERALLEAQGLAAGVARGLAEGAIHAVGVGHARGRDELARHKALDLLGDLALLGKRLHARVQVDRGGHALHHRLVSRLAALDSAGPGSEDAHAPLEVR